MEKTVKKLVLGKETLRDLTPSEMRRAVGGAADGAQNVLPPPTGCDNTGIICEYSERTCCFSV
ncbi:MAG: class I lanthipeptide [Actinomycetota bacterium]|nr:class I lanthipeptide [Actinomycetota bacterium]